MFLEVIQPINSMSEIEVAKMIETDEKIDIRCAPLCMADVIFAIFLIAIASVIMDVLGVR